MLGLLSQLIVLHLSRVPAGPCCTHLLANLGVTVIMIERPGKGDDTGAGAAVPQGRRRLLHVRGGLLPRVQPRRTVGGGRVTVPENQHILRDFALNAAENTLWLSVLAP
jgi:2-polyprenyl-6-methoxyphenol hydroxylase-like FAD-dependent oxidoreductase